MEEQVPTLDEIKATIRAARDSVWVITDTIHKLTNGEAPSESLKGNIQRNVDHLKHVTSSAHVKNSGENIADLLSAISTGEAKLAENIW